MALPISRSAPTAGRPPRPHRDPTTTLHLARRAPSAPPALPDPTAAEGEAARQLAWGQWEGAARSVLPSGLRVVTAALPRSGSVAVALGIAAGFRHESEAQSGLSHVLEHMCFRGSEHWPTKLLLTLVDRGAAGRSTGTPTVKPPCTTRASPCRTCVRPWKSSSTWCAAPA